MRLASEPGTADEAAGGPPIRLLVAIAVVAGADRKSVV